MEKEKRKLTKVEKGLIVFVILIFWMMFILAKDDSPKQVTTQNTTSSFSIGDDGILSNQDIKTNCEGGTIVGTTKENYERFVELIVADDRLGYSGMLGNGLLISVDNCTKIKKIGGSFSMSEVRILEGEYLGTSGWTAIEHAVK